MSFTAVLYVQLYFYYYFLLKINEECTKNSKYKTQTNKGACDKDEM